MHYRAFDRFDTPCCERRHREVRTALLCGKGSKLFVKRYFEPRSEGQYLHEEEDGYEGIDKHEWIQLCRELYNQK